MYFNEHDRFAAQWLRNLYPEATVDERDIRDVTADDVVRFRRVHFFGGIGGWQLALDLAGWGDDEIWTGSCPCQPFSSAGKRKGVEDERHLWPEFRRLIEECRPATIFGEQVASKDGREWLAGVRADLEALGYAVGAADLCAAGATAPQLRQRLFWVACTESERGRADIGTVRSRKTPRLRSEEGEDERRAGEQAGRTGDCRATGRVADEPHDGRKQRIAVDGRNGEGVCAEGIGSGPSNGSWSGAVVIDCLDGNLRRVEPSAFPLAARIPRDVGRRIPELRRVAASARANRVGRLRGYGNAIVPQVAATFIRAFMETRLTP
jgi:DNA (cytosine-5)-methyltransferase 1